MPPPDLWAGCITYMVRFVKVVLGEGPRSRKAQPRIRSGATIEFGVWVVGWRPDRIVAGAMGQLNPAVGKSSKFLFEQRRELTLLTIWLEFQLVDADNPLSKQLL